jgi:hypothetical protein
MFCSPTGNASSIAKVLQWFGRGVQVYSCQRTGSGYAWDLQRPDATLTDSRGIFRGRNEVGPSWIATDGSRVLGKIIAVIPAPNRGAIPWLVLSVKSHYGHGALESVAYIFRTDTKGGIAPASGCDAYHDKNIAEIGYSAIYTFLLLPTTTRRSPR